MSDLIVVLGYGLIGGLFSTIGGLLLLWRDDLAKKIMTPLLAFSAGAFMAASFLDVLPEALEMSSEPHPIMIALLAGFSLFFIMERYLMRHFFGHHTHEHAEHTESLPILVVTGDSIHNFLDGMLIGLTYLANPVLGLATTLAIAAHEIPQEIGDFSILYNQGWAKKKIVLVNILQSLLTIPGILLGYYAGSSLESSLPYLLAGAAGIFLYIAASDLIPELHHRAGHKHFKRIIIPFIVSIVLVGYFTALAH